MNNRNQKLLQESITDLENYGLDEFAELIKNNDISLFNDLIKNNFSFMPYIDNSFGSNMADCLNDEMSENMSEFAFSKLESIKDKLTEKNQLIITEFLNKYR
ncbi:hypothetical protein ACLIX2_09090 [Proteus cibi]